tara:strand:- start:15627 stop:16007 length:381 start_codon:yes stop_codon:yes gene_type:complete
LDEFEKNLTINPNKTANNIITNGFPLKRSSIKLPSLGDRGEKIELTSNSTTFDITRPSAIPGLIPKSTLELTKSDMEIAIIVEIKYKIKVRGTIFCKFEPDEKEAIEKEIVEKIRKGTNDFKIIKK